MQKFTTIDPMKFVSDSSADINNALNSLLSNNAGTVFPTTNLTEGMLCYRTDLKKVYQLKSVSPVAWTMIADLNTDLSVAIGKLLPLTGGAMTGNVSYAMYNSTQIPVKVYGGDSNGQGISIGAGGATIVGGGESKNLVEQNLAATNETLYLSSDNAIRLVSNLDTGWGARKEATFDAGTLTVPGKVKAPLLEGNLTGDVTGSVTGNLRGNVNGNLTGTVNGNITGNANTATKLQTARKINGIAFDGTGDITLPASAVFNQNSSIAFGNGSQQPYRHFTDISSPNAIDVTSGSGDLYTLYFRTNVGLAAGTYTLSSILQNLINKTHTHDIFASRYNCNCNCDCDSDNDSDGSCFITGSILTDRGYKDIRNLQIGDKVLDGIGGRGTVAGLVSGCLGKRKAVTFAKNVGIVLTEEHLIYTDKGIGCYDLDTYLATKSKILSDNGIDGTYETDGAEAIRGKVMVDRGDDFIADELILAPGYDARTKTYSPIIEGCDSCIVNGYRVRCAQRVNVW